LILNVQGALGITGSGITELINARKEIVERGGAVVLMGVKRRIESMIQVSGLEKYFSIVSTECEALQLFNRKSD
jgi:anti-anti-sigma factor